MASNTSAEADQKMKTRIITHMNADHAASLSLYAQHYSRLPASSTKVGQVTLADISTQHMILSSPFGRNLIAFDPPLGSLSESRARLVQMNADALRGLGFDESGVVVNRYLLPNRAYQWALLVLVGWMFATLPFPRLIHPANGSWVSKVFTLGGLVPQNGWLAWKLQPVLLPGMVLIHGGEALWLATTRLRKFQVRAGSWIWWCWMVDCFLEGFGSFVRFDAEVRRLKEKKGGKH